MLQSSHLAEISRWQDAIRAARTDGARLKLRGGSSKDALDRGPLGLVAAARALDAADARPIRAFESRGLSGILSYEPSELVITALSGTPLEDIESALAEKGQALAFEPPQRGFCAHPQSRPTWGGTIASGLAGPGRASAGGVRDFVLGAGFVNGLGEHLIFGGQVMKNVAGYDVSRLLAGSWGRLGWITQASLKVLPIAVAQATLRVACSAQQALDWLNGWGGQPLPLSASCWQSGQGGTLTLRLRGAQAAVDSAVPKLLAQMGQGTAVLMPQVADAFWNMQRNASVAAEPAPSPAHSLWRVNAAQTLPADLCDAHQIDHHGAQRWVWADAAQAQALLQQCQANAMYATVFIAANDLNTPTCEPKSFKNRSSAASEAAQDRVLRSCDPDMLFVP